jgi:GT2 family glycosyltransferase
MLYVIVPVHNRAPVTARFLDALVGQTVTDYQLVLVDDGCTDQTVGLARSKLPAERLVVLSGDGQLWWAGALQMAYEHLCSTLVSDVDLVLIINDDVSFEPDFLAMGRAVLAEYPGACVQAVGVDRKSGTVDRGAIADLVSLGFRAAEPGEPANCLSTRGLLMDAGTFVRSGGFRPRWLPHYLSDYEFTLRLRRQGALLRVDERFTVGVELELTGLNRPSLHTIRGVWEESFSNRAKFNPKHWTAFVAMACPVWVAPWHIARIWMRFGRSLLTAAWSKPRTCS